MKYEMIISKKTENKTSSKWDFKKTIRNLINKFNRIQSYEDSVSPYESAELIRNLISLDYVEFLKEDDYSKSKNFIGCGARTNAKTIKEFKEEFENKKKNFHGKGKNVYIGFKIDCDEDIKKYQKFCNLAHNCLKKNNLEYRI